MIFLLDARCLCIESNITAKKTALIPNWRGAFPLGCGQNTKTAAPAGNLMHMAMGARALGPSSDITGQWLIYAIVQHMPARGVPPPCAMPSWAIAYRVCHCAAPAHGMLFLCAFHTPTSKGVVTLRALIQGYNRAYTQRPPAQAHAIKGPKGPQKSVPGLGYKELHI